MKVKKLTALALALAMMFALVACATSDQPTPTSGSSSSDPTPAANNPGEDAPAPPPPAEKKTVYVLVKVLGNQYWSVVEAGARKAGEDLGCNVVIIGTAAESEVEKQVALLQDAVSAKADAIVIAPLDRKAMAAPVSEQFKSNIPMILIDSSVDTEDYSAAYLTDNIAAGRLAAETMLAKLKAIGTPEDKEGVIAVTIGSTGSQAIIDRDDGFKEYWDANAPATWKVLWDEIKVNDGDTQKAVTFGQDFITAYPNLIGLFAPNNGSTVGFVKALEESGRTDITMVGFDFSAEMEAIVRNSDYNVATILQRQYFMGYDGVAKALEIANGGTVTEKVVDTGVMVVDNANVDSQEVQNIVNGG
ncbi:MAG: ABC transporter substrate-binding protein [Oscillospiraceae bacterium]|jgi:ribose transport system substrate-binding protein|nr:ABC transporter substrate-binding protein [Oscillospiraceae bacterium]